MFIFTRSCFVNLSSVFAVTSTLVPPSWWESVCSAPNYTWKAATPPPPNTPSPPWVTPNWARCYLKTDDGKEKEI